MKISGVRPILFILIALWVAPVAASAQAPDEAVRHKVGVIMPLTGTLAEYAVATRNGIELAQLAHPELFEGISFDFEDSAFDPKRAIAAFNKLRSVDHATVIADWGAQTSQAIAPIAQAYKFPFVTLSIEPAVSAGREYVVRFHSDAEQYAQTLIAYLHAHGYKRLALIKAEIVYFNKIFDGLKHQLPPGMSIEVIAAVDPGQNSFKSEIAKLSKGSFDAVGVFLLSGQISQFYREAAQQKVKLPTFGTDFFDDPQEIAAAAGGMNGAVFPEYGPTKDFRSAYLEHFHNTVQLPYAGLAYDFAVHIAKALNSLPTTHQGAQVVDAITALASGKGVLGSYHFENTTAGGKAFSFPFVLRRIRDGEIVDAGD